MSGVKRWWLPESLTRDEATVFVKRVEMVLASDYDAVVKERDAGEHTIEVQRKQLDWWRERAEAAEATVEMVKAPRQKYVLNMTCLELWCSACKIGHSDCSVHGYGRCVERRKGERRVTEHSCTCEFCGCDNRSRYDRRAT